jgi:hypothetical protein
MIGLELMHSLSLYYAFFLAIVTSDLFFVFGATGLVRIGLAGPYGLVWLFAFLFFFLQLAIVLAYENQKTPLRDIVLIFSMYFTYCQLWIPVAVWAFYDDFVTRRPVKWAKTRRFLPASQKINSQQKN